MKRATGTGAKVSKVLRQAIRDSGLTLYRISKDSGVQYMALYRFARGRTMLSLDAVDKLAEYLGLRLVRDE
jgi:hypothetical protein